MLPKLLLLLPLAAAACGTDPYDRPGTFRLQGVNDANLRAMVADPAHRQRGAEALTARGTAAAAPVERLRTDKRRPLPGTEGGGAQLNALGGQNGSR
jgi:hypothetical protein